MASTTTTTPAKTDKPRMSQMALQEQRWGRLFVAAPFVGFCLFSAFPIVFAFVASLSNWTGTNSVFANFCGLFTDSRFWMTVGTTIIYMTGIPVGMILGLLIATAMNRRIPGVKILRTMYYVPVISSLVAVAILWAWVFNYDFGLLNLIIKALTGAKGPNWLGDEAWIKVAMIIFMVWKGLGTSVILYGATGWQAFKNITIPLVSPVTFYLLITGIIGGFQVFVEVSVMTTNGGVNYSAATVVYYLWDKAFKHQQMGYGAAMAFILAIIIFIVTAINFKGQDKWVKTID